MTSVTHPIELSIVRQFSSNEDVELATRCIATISEGLSSDVLVSYFTRNDPSNTAAVWQEQLRAAVRVNPAAQQFYCLKDCTAAAFVLEYPKDSPSTWSSLRLMPIVPLGKWRVLNEWVTSKEKQKAAFSRAHGSFLYLMALIDAHAGSTHDTAQCLTVLKAVFEVADADQLMVYVEARPQQRAFLRLHGFVDVMSYKVRDSSKTPFIYIMNRPPAPPPAVLPTRR